MWSSGDLCSQSYRCGIHTVSDCVTVIGGQNATLYRYPLLWPDGSRGESSAGRPRPDKVHKPARTAHDARSRRECLRPRLTGPRGVPALDPRPSILVPRSSFDTTRRCSRPAACARHRRTCAVSGVPRGRARAAAAAARAAPSRGAARGRGRGVCCSDGRVGSGSVESLPGRRKPPSPPPRPPVCRTQRDRGQ